MENKIMYKWKNPKNKIEEYEVLTLVEDRGLRVLVESSFSGMSLDIIPTFVYNKSELKEV